MAQRVEKSDHQWREELPADRYHVMREQGTEPPFTGGYTYSKEDGMYRCGACGLAPKRSIAMVRAAREVAAGRADLSEHEPAWRRLRTIPEVGSWTLEKLAFAGQGRDDQLPAGDLAFVKLVGRLEGLGRRATEEEVRDYFAPYGEFAGLAGLYALWSRR